AGQDLNDRVRGPGEKPVDLGDSIERNYAPLVRTLRALPLPVVCAVNGVAAGAGANVALACDIVVAKRSASFIEPFCRLGLIPDTGGTYFLPRLVGRRSEEHTSELQSRENLVCRLLLEKKKAAEEFGARFFGSGTNLGGVMKHPGKISHT